MNCFCPRWATWNLFWRQFIKFNQMCSSSLFNSLPKGNRTFSWTPRGTPFSFWKLLGVFWLPCPRWPRERLPYRIPPGVWARTEHLSGRAEGRSLAPHLALPCSRHSLRARAVKTAGRASSCHCKYYRCLWYAEKQEEQHLPRPGGRQTKWGEGRRSWRGVWEERDQ